MSSPSPSSPSVMESISAKSSAASPDPSDELVPSSSSVGAVRPMAIPQSSSPSSDPTLELHPPDRASLPKPTPALGLTASSVSSVDPPSPVESPRDDRSSIGTYLRPRPSRSFPRWVAVYHLLRRRRGAVEEVVEEVVVWWEERPSTRRPIPVKRQRITAPV